MVEALAFGTTNAPPLVDIPVDRGQVGRLLRVSLPEPPRRLGPRGFAGALLGRFLLLLFPLGRKAHIAPLAIRGSGDVLGVASEARPRPLELRLFLASQRH
eukprot:6392630-Prymnesium_polylepis.1